MKLNFHKMHEILESMTRKSNNIRKIVKKETEINSEKAVFGISDIKLTNHPNVND